MKKIIILIIAFFIASPVLFAQGKAGKKDTMQHAVYTCPMHPDIKADKPGKCPTCGMELLLSKKEQLKTGIAKTYSCPSHIDVVSDKPGKCPKCGNELLLSKKEKLKLEVVKSYACPMHPDEKSNKPGKCSKCGMDMTEVKKDKSTKHKY